MIQAVISHEAPTPSLRRRVTSSMTQPTVVKPHELVQHNLANCELLRDYLTVITVTLLMIFFFKKVRFSWRLLCFFRNSSSTSKDKSQRESVKLTFVKERVSAVQSYLRKLTDTLSKRRDELPRFAEGDNEVKDRNAHPAHAQVSSEPTSSPSPKRPSRLRSNSALYAALRVMHRIGKVVNPNRKNWIQAYIVSPESRDQIPIVIDTGCSVSLTPFKSDFISEIFETDAKEMHGLSSSTKIEGYGLVQWDVIDVFGKVETVRTYSYYIPDAPIRLFSVQSYFKENDGGKMKQDQDKVIIETPKGIELTFPYDSHSNLPLIYLNQESDKCLGVPTDLMSNLGSTELLESTISLLDDMNHNLNVHQKELMLWHYRLCHAGQGWIQDLMRKRKLEVGVPSEDPIILTGTHSKASSCDHPTCPACRLAKMHKRSTGSQLVSAKPEKEMALKRSDLKPGDTVSLDQYTSKTPGRLPHTRGKEQVGQQYNGGTIMVDHASGYIFLNHQISLRLGDTIQGKHKFETFAQQYGVRIRSYHADNHPFAGKEFLKDIETNDQTITYSAVGAHFQNGVAERAIQTITSWALGLMMHQLIHWPQAFDDTLWPFAMEHAVNVWNHLPKVKHGLSPFELFTGIKSPNHDFIRSCRVWGCPVYVLDPKLQDSKKLPKWTKRSHLGMYLGTSSSHASTVGRILNLRTGHISNQYHLMFDETFSSVSSLRNDQLDIPLDMDSWTKLFRLGGHERLQDPLDPSDVPRQDLYHEFLDEPVSDPDAPPPPVPPTSEGAALPPLASEGERPQGHREPQGEAAEAEPGKRKRGRPKGSKNKPKQTIPDKPRVVRPRQTRNTLRRMLNRTQAHTQLRSDPEYTGSYFIRDKARTNPHHSLSHRLQYLALGNENQKIKAKKLTSSWIQSLKWSLHALKTKSVSNQKILNQLLKSYDHLSKELSSWHPLALAAKSNDPNTLTWEQAMNGPDAEGYWEAAKAEIDILLKMDVWEEVDRQPWMNILPSTWSFRQKYFPNGLPRKKKGRFCARGDKQIEGIDFFETYAPVVNWITVRLILVLTAQLGLATKQVDYTAAFVHADIDLPPNYEHMTKEEKERQGVYIEMPRGFKVPGKVLKLKKSLYGLKQSPRNFFMHLKANLERAGFTQAVDVDPCLFISDKVICLTYVDDCIMVSDKAENIDKVISRLRDIQNMQLEEEDDVAGFLGVHIERTPNHVKLTQKGLTKRIVETLQIEHLPPVSTPADRVLGKDLEGEPPYCTFNYASVIGMLWYLYGHSRPDLGFAVSQAARFAFSPKRSHELALIRIGQYLKGTMDKGLIMTPATFDQFHMEVYVDSDFLGLYGGEQRSDPDNVRSRAGHVILINECPIIWSSRLMTSVALSTMMAEYYALSASLREALPLRDLVRAVAQGCGLNDSCKTTFKTTVWEDNMGALTLAKLEPGHNTTRSKHFDSKVHWFRSYLRPNEGDPNRTTVEKIESRLQRADIMTKHLPKDTFEFLRKLLMGW